MTAPAWASTCTPPLLKKALRGQKSHHQSRWWCQTTPPRLPFPVLRTKMCRPGPRRNAPTLHYLLGRIHERRRNFREAADEYRKVINESELVRMDYSCQHCGEHSTRWVDRCANCGEWNSVEVNFREEIPLEDLGIPAAPIYTSRS